MCARNNSCALSAALSVALSLEASPSRVVESIIDFGSDLLLDFVPLSQLLSGKAAVGAAAAGGAGAMHMLTQACDASCLGNTLADGGHLLAQHADSLAGLADGLAGLADDAVGGQVLKVIAAAGVAFAVRRALEPVTPLSPRSAAAAERARREQAAAITPLATTIALSMLASSSSNPVAAKALMETQQAPEPLSSPKAVAAAATAAAESAIKDAASWPSKLKRRVRKAAAEINEGKLSLMGVLVALDVAAAVHNAGDIAQMVQQVAGGS